MKQTFTSKLVFWLKNERLLIEIGAEFMIVRLCKHRYIIFKFRYLEHEVSDVFPNILYLPFAEYVTD